MPSPSAIAEDRPQSAVAPDTVFETDEGPLPAEWLRPGHRIRTESGGFLEVLAVDAAGAGPGGVTVPADAIEDGVPRAALTVAPGHLLLVRHPAAEFYFGTPAVFVEASDLVGINGILRAQRGADQSFLRVALAEAAVVTSEGLGLALLGPDGAIPDHPVLHEGEALVLRDALRREWQAHRQSA